MNLVISGRIDDSLRNAVIALTAPRNVVRLHADAYRLEGADDSTAVRDQVLTICDAARVDQAYIEEGLRFSDFKLLAMDMDSTLITIECIDEIADFAGKKKEVAAITEAAMRGEITDFAESLRRRVALLEGVDEGVLEQVFDERLLLTEGANVLLDAAKANQTYTLLLSGGFTFFSDRLRCALRLSAAYANVLEIKDQKLTGRVIDPILDATAKRAHVQVAIAKINCGDDEVLVIGDGANDIPMMQLAKNSIAFKAKPATNAAARNVIKYGTLATVLDYFGQ
jgi:phosphoserine phosphatase